MAETIKDPTLTALTHRIRIPVKECDYEEFLMSGTRIIQYGVDAASELNIRRDGQAGMLASVQAKLLNALYGLDMIEVTAKIVKAGNRSRTIAFEVCKTIARGYVSFDGTIKNEVLAEPVKVAEGEVVLVLEEQFM